VSSSSIGRARKNSSEEQKLKSGSEEQKLKSGSEEEPDILLLEDKKRL